ncbi:MAG: PQQ-like beta-propeller repeat protein [Geodermatophilaceae bacterium]|nr:PQQ-like beta-propeller repeat protein [Geodermatophilaceae bacterium]
MQIGNREAISIRIPGGPDWLAADDEHVYIMRDEGGVDVLDPATGAVLSSIELTGHRCQGLGAADGSLWACSGADERSELFRLDPTTGDIEARVATTKAYEQGHLIIGFGRVWVLLGDGSSMVGIDLNTNAPGEPIPLPIRGTDLALGSDGVWVVSAVDNAAVEVDPDRGVAGRLVEGLDRARVAVEVPGALWVGGAVASYRVDLATSAVTATVDGGVGTDGGISADAGGIWVRKGGVTLQHLDAATGAIIEEISAEIGTGGDILVAFDAVWVSFHNDATLLRIPLSY